ncbi:hypothetical protein HO133_003191 [Letharia lupina]|uniref:DUF4185 domain-containing protein n=1 Tax=Letharia lupina TaxID=560253 RepID=A0A8H6CC39_9LECA|nr:uncharacterized protein HO133_003191 [Letharia lupina]KAF6220757.1 hypothetical protein HO133_003191 [Letharia lupina]
MTNKQGFAAYPPKVKHTEILGYVEEVNGIFHSRDIGRGFELFGNVYLEFGDTFCNDSNGEFVGLANNTVAIIEDTNQPLKSKYLEVEENGFIKPFIPLTFEEQQLEGRVVLWAFGGVVEMKDGTGRLWYQKSIDHGSGNLEYFGTGVAKVIENYGEEQQPIVHRMDNLTFGPDEPRMGTFTAIADGDFIYLFGDRPDGKIILARVYDGRYQGRLGEKEAHYYWDGSDWVQDWGKAAVVIEGMQQGAIVRSKLFGEARPFVFVGTSKWADSQVFMGASAKLEGPWKLEAVCKAEGIKEPTSKGKWMYCIYPQLWASDEENAELMVTWSEQCPGGIVAAKIKLAGVEDDDIGS